MSQDSEIDLNAPGQRVMIAIDSSETAEHAFKFYMDTLHRPNDEVVFAHAAEPPYIGTGLGVAGYGFITGSQYEEMIHQKRHDVRRLLDHYTELIGGKEIKYEVHAVEYGGKTGEAIIQMAKDQKADLVVMGTRGLGKLRRTILGSVSDYVVHHAHCPVVMCHHPDYPYQKKD